MSAYSSFKFESSTQTRKRTLTYHTCWAKSYTHTRIMRMIDANYAQMDADLLGEILCLRALALSGKDGC